jgi:hypothetical protein
MNKNLRELKALNKKYKISVKIVKNLPDLSNDPVFVAKNKKATEFLAKHPFPEDFKTKPKPQGSKPKAKRAKRNA